MIVSHESRYVYIALPKTACQAISQWLHLHYKGEYVPPMTHRWWPPERCEDYLVFTVVRNPYERCFSGWWWGCQCPVRKQVAEARGDIAEFWGWSFDRFMRRRIEKRDDPPRNPETGGPNVYMPQIQFFRLSGASRVFHYENLDELEELPFVGEWHPIERRNVTQTKPTRSFFDYFADDPQAEQLVWDYCAEDFDAFGYERGKA